MEWFKKERPPEKLTHTSYFCTSFQDVSWRYFNARKY